jgi:hypothetical protein
VALEPAEDREPDGMRERPHRAWVVELDVTVWICESHLSRVLSHILLRKYEADLGESAVRASGRGAGQEP